MNWEYKERLDLIKNLKIISCIKDNILVHYRIYPIEGYMLWIPTLDKYECDDDENIMLDENGEPILISHYYTNGGATAMPTYDWRVNPNQYQAIRIKESD